jgi:type VI secretion system secreted protein Hcp
MRKIILSLTLLILLVGMAIPVDAAIYIKYDGIEGESADAHHDKWIDVLSIDWGANKPTGSSGASRRRGGTVVEDFTFTKEVDSSTPKLTEPICKGEHTPGVEVDICKTNSDGEQHCYLKYKLKDVYITSYGIEGEADVIPTETISLNFKEIEVEYVPERGDGTEASSAMCSQ